MKLPTHRTWAEINLDIIAHNTRIIRSITDKNAMLAAVVKADAYGHGAKNIALEMLANGVDYLAVACIDEAQQLRNLGITAPILILSYTPHEDMKRVAELDITQTIYSLRDAEALSEAAALCGKTVKIHIKLDTGMNRIGFISDDPDTIDTIKKISLLKNIFIEGIFTHFAKADENDNSYTLMQFEKFNRCCRALEEENIKIPVKHVCNSAGILKFKNMHCDMVRCGIISYGLAPSHDVEIRSLNLLPAMSIKTAVTRIQYIKKGEKISYGGTYVAGRDMKIATLPIGYADGYSRLLSNKAKVIIGGEYANVVGRICMDQCMIDVTDVNNIDVGDVATVIGRDADKEVSCELLADMAGTINYEIACMISIRVPRIYVSGGKIVDVMNYLV